MSWAESVSRISGSLVWPLIVLIIILMFYSRINRLLDGTLSRLKVGPVEAEWSEQREIAEGDINEALPVSSSTRNQTLPLRLRPAAQASPSSAILTAFRELEQLLRDLAEKGGLRLPSG